MRRLTVGTLGKSSSVLGLGCAALGSRISKSESLKSIGRAFDRGINWFDVAPPYGDGEAEGILGSFFAKRRDDIIIVTKFGISPSKPSIIRHFMKPVARPILGAFPELKRAARAVGGAQNEGVLITPEAIEESIQRSLARLRTDYVDVFLLHEPTPQQIADKSIRDKIAELIRSKRVLSAGVATTLPPAVSLPVAPFSFAQYAPALAKPSDVAVLLPPGLVTIFHSIYGIGGHYSEIRDALGRDEQFRRSLSALGYTQPPRIAARAFLLDYALSLNIEGVCLLSLNTERHLDEACKQASTPPRDPAAFKAAISAIVHSEGA